MNFPSIVDGIRVCSNLDGECMLVINVNLAVLRVLWM
jgi:hypothetical protein